MKNETKCVQCGYQPKKGEPRVLPIAQSTTFKYDTTEEVGDLFDLKTAGFFYTRLSNPTVAAVEEKIAALEGGVGALMTASGMSATTLTVYNLAKSGDHIVSSGEIYGGTVNLFSVTMKKLGIEVTYVDINDFQAVEKAIRPNTKLIFGESLANPALSVMDIEKIADIAHKHKIPLVVDATFTPAVICRPFEWGADIVIHSTSKYMDGHAVSLGGVVVDSGNFDYKNSGKFPEFTTPDNSYHGLVYSDAFGKAAFITKLRVQMMRDYGVAPSPHNAFLLNLGLETLHLRMERHSENAQKVAEFLFSDKKIKKIKYPGLSSDPDFERAKKYFDKGRCSGVITFDLASREKAVTFMNSLKLAAIVVHVADARTGVLHPASATHRQLTDAQLIEAGINPGTIRFSVGIESAEDIIADIKQALEKI